MELFTLKKAKVTPSALQRLATSGARVLSPRESPPAMMMLSGLAAQIRQLRSTPSSYLGIKFRSFLLNLKTSYFASIDISFPILFFYSTFFNFPFLIALTSDRIPENITNTPDILRTVFFVNSSLTGYI